MEEQTIQYLMKLAIDFGSTNTVMAWRVYEKQADGERKISEQFNSVNPIRKIPTTMVLREDNPGNEIVTADVFGTDALEVFNQSSQPVVIRNNFKQSLYTTDPRDPLHTEGVRLTELFFEYLRKVYVTEALNALPQYVKAQLEVVLYLSLPVRKTPYHRSKMEAIAQAAGFTPENGVSRISTELDEAECVVRYAMEQARPGMSQVLAKANTPDGALLLFVDVGGSTMDMTLKRMKIRSDDSVQMDELSSWPNQDVKYPLGGCLVDEAIKDYLIRCGFAVPELLEKNWRSGKAKESVRRLKEHYNQTLSTGGTIEKLGNQVLDMLYDINMGQMPPVIYAISDKKINGKNYVDEICKEYIGHMRQALAELFSEKFQKPMRNRPLAAPSDVDAVFLAGAGGRLFFIPLILRDPTVGFAKVCEDPNLLFADWTDPSLCCVLGALADREDIVSSKFSKCTYMLQYQVYTHSGMLTSHIKEDPTLLDPDGEQCTVDGSTYPCRCVLNNSMPIAEKFEELPIEREIKVTTDYTDNGNEATLCLNVLRIDDEGNVKTVGAPLVHSIGRTMSQTLASVVKTLALLPVGVFADVAAMGADAIIDLLFNDSDKRTRTFQNLSNKAWESAINPIRDSNLGVRIQVRFGEDLELVIKADVESKYLENGSSSFELEL